MALIRWTCLLLFAACAPALAAQNVFQVTNVNDSGTGSLRQAITDANATPNVDALTADEIRFQPAAIGTLTLSTPLQLVTEGVSIIGPGRTLLTITGSNTMRVFETDTGDFLGVSRMTLAFGLATGDGGAIYSRGFTVISDVFFDECHALGASSGSGPGAPGRGGAIYHEPLVAELWVTNSLFNDCTAIGGNGTSSAGGDGFGGALCIFNGVGRISLSTFQQCESGGGSSASSGIGGDGYGGGVYSEISLDLDDVTFDGCAAYGGPSTTASSAGGSGSGGGVYSQGPVDALRVTISVCTCTGGDPGTGGVSGDAWGGGLTIESGTSLLRLCEIELCTCTSASGGSVYGAGLYSEGSVTVRESIITGCVGSDLGGGLYYEGTGTVTVDRTTISNCTGVGIRANGGTNFFIVNSTISGNGNGFSTGGIWNSNAVMQISFTTVTDNIGTTWGGVYRTGGTLSIVGCIVAGNTGSGGNTDIGAGGSMTIQNSVVGIQDSDAIAVNGTSGNQVGTLGSPLSPMLGPLTANGGPTPTHALLTGSPAINMGGSTGAPATDQRNAPRDQGVPDAGSYEFGATPPNTGGTAGGEGDARCSTSNGTSIGWLALLGALAVIGVAARLRRA